MATKVAVAGTFNVLHEGHKALLDRAMWMADELYIGITSDEMAKANRKEIIPYYLRRRAIEDYVMSKGEIATIFPIDDIYGPPEIMDDIDVLVVSEETAENGKLVSRMREKRGIRPLKLDVVSLYRNCDGGKLNASDIMEGKMSRDGQKDVVRVAVGSTNRVKVEAVREVMETIYGSVRIYSVDVKSGVPEGIDMHLLYILHVLNTSVSYFLFAYRGAVLNAYHRQDVVTNIRTLVSLRKDTVNMTDTL